MESSWPRRNFQRAGSAWNLSANCFNSFGLSRAGSTVKLTNNKSLRSLVRFWISSMEAVTCGHPPRQRVNKNDATQTLPFSFSGVQVSPVVSWTEKEPTWPKGSPSGSPPSQRRHPPTSANKAHRARVAMARLVIGCSMQTGHLAVALAPSLWRPKKWESTRTPKACHGGSGAGGTRGTGR